MSKKSRNVAVIGLGTFGVAIANELSRLGDTVLAIDNSESCILNVSDEVSHTLQADATDPKALKECGLEAYNIAIVSIGQNLEASILTAMNLLEFGDIEVWVKAQTPTHRKVLKAIGVHHVILPEQAYGVQLAQRIHDPILKDFLALGEDTYLVKIKFESEELNTILQDKEGLRAQGIECLGIFVDDRLVTLEEAKPTLKGHAVLIGKQANLRKLARSI